MYPKQPNTCLKFPGTSICQNQSNNATASLGGWAPADTCLTVGNESSIEKGQQLMKQVPTIRTQKTESMFKKTPRIGELSNWELGVTGRGRLRTGRATFQWPGGCF